MKAIFSNPTLSFSLIALISFSSLSLAFIAEAIFNLEPCALCIYQRYPFAIGLLIGVIGLIMRNKDKILAPLLGICGLNFLVNSVIASYHTGIEQKWWTSAVEGCAVIFPDSNEGQSILENIMSAPMGDCSKIPWQDPIFGFSMANYNIPFCFGLFIFCIISAVMITKTQKQT